MTDALARPAPTSTFPLPDPPNLGEVERWLSILLGAALLGAVVRRGGALPLIVGALGAALLARGVTRRDPVARVMRQTEAERAAARQRGWSEAAIASATVTVQRPRAEVYRFWRDFTNLPRFMEGVKRIDVIDGQRSRWTVAAPGGATVTWEAVIVRDEENRRIGWESEDGSDVNNAGAVRFRDTPDGRGTEVEAELTYQPPAGALGRAVVAMFKEKPQLQVRQGLERLKALMEAGQAASAKQLRPRQLQPPDQR